MAIPSGYRKITSADVGKTFGKELEPILVFNNSIHPNGTGGGIVNGSLIEFLSGNKITLNEDKEFGVATSMYYNSELLYKQESIIGGEDLGFVITNLNLQNQKISAITPLCINNNSNLIYIKDKPTSKKVELLNKDIVIYPKTTTDNVVDTNGNKLDSILLGLKDIVSVVSLPIASENEYNKHLLYIFKNNLFYLSPNLNTYKYIKLAKDDGSLLKKVDIQYTEDGGEEIFYIGDNPEITSDRVLMFDGTYGVIRYGTLTGGPVDESGFPYEIATINLLDKKLDKVSNEEYVVYGTGRKDGASGQAPQRTIQYNQQPYGNGIVQRMSDGRVKGTTATEDNDLTNLAQVNGLLANAKAIIDVAELPTQDINENVIYRVSKEVASEPVAVPNTGNVKGFYLNKKLSAKEVSDILKTIKSSDSYYYFIADLAKEFAIAIVQYDEGTPDEYYEVSDLEGIVYFNSNDGWLNENFPGDYLEGNWSVSSEISGIQVGNQNELLKNVFSMTPFIEPKTFVDYYAIKNGVWNKINIDNAIEDVDSLPTENIKDNVIYRVTKELGGAVAVPNNSYVENIYLNTKLGTDEVVAILDGLNLSIDEPYYVIIDVVTQLILQVYYSGSSQYEIEDEDNVYFDNVVDESMPEKTLGWQPASKSGVINGKWDASSVVGDTPIGDKNESLINLFSITPFGEKFKISDYYVYKNNSWKQINTDKAIIDVEKLPTSDIDDNDIYRLITSKTSRPTSVANTGYIKSVYFDTTLDEDKIGSILDASGIVFTSSKNYLVLSNESQTFTLEIGYTKSDGILAILINRPGEASQNIFLSKKLSEMVGLEWSGWNKDYVGKALPINDNVTNINNGRPVGEFNDKIKEIVSTTPLGLKEYFYSYHIHKENIWQQLTTDAYSLAEKIEGSADVAVDVNETGDKLNVHLDNEFKKTLATKQILNNYMPKHTFNNDIFSAEFYNLLIATPDVNSGDLFVVHTQTETPQDAIAKGFPALEVGSIVYGYLDLGQLDSPLIVSTSMGSFKITDGSGTLTCESLGGGGFEPKAVTINQPASATNGNLSAEQLATLQANDLNYIVFNNEIFFLNDKTHTADTLTYSHVGYENNKHLIKTISITISTRSWVLNKSEIGGGGISYEEVE